MAENGNRTATTSTVTTRAQENAGAIADDWESIAADQVQQITQDRLTLIQQQQKSSADEQRYLNESLQQAEPTPGTLASMIAKPIKILKREQPTRLRSNNSESGPTDEEKLMEKLSLEERKAKYDKIRERIFAETAAAEESSSKAPTNSEPAKPSTSSEVNIEPINHLSNVQMLTEQVPSLPPQILSIPPPSLNPLHNSPMFTGQAQQGYPIFVGDLSPEVDKQMLIEKFAPFGEVLDAKVIRDPQTMKPKGYGFVSYMSYEQAERAIFFMNGQTIGSRVIRTNWAVRKNGPPPTGFSAKGF